MRGKPVGTTDLLVMAEGSRIREKERRPIAAQSNKELSVIAEGSRQGRKKTRRPTAAQLNKLVQDQEMGKRQLIPQPDLRYHVTEVY